MKEDIKQTDSREMGWKMHFGLSGGSRVPSKAKGPGRDGITAPTVVLSSYAQIETDFGSRLLLLLLRWPREDFKSICGGGNARHGGTVFGI